MLKVNSNERVRWRVVVVLLRKERERESYKFWGMMFSNDTRKIFKKIF